MDGIEIPFGISFEHAHKILQSQKNKRQHTESIVALNEKRSRRRYNTSATGIMKPLLISNELANFLHLPCGSAVARTEVTKAIHSYIRDNKLKHPRDGRVVILDECLRTLLKVQKNDLSFFNLQTHLTSHFS